MKTALNRTQTAVLTGMAAIAVLGGAGLWYLSGQVGAVREEIDQQSGTLQQLAGGRYYPSAQNVEALKKNNAALEAALGEIRQRLQGGAKELNGAVEKNAVVFKQEMADRLKKLREEAAHNGVRIDPAAADFGFSMYRNANPSDSSTGMLGRQLLGIEAVSDALFRARVSSLDAVRRTQDENGDGQAKGPEAIPLRVTPLPGGTYTLYPLEFEFTGTEDAVREGLANLAASPLFLVPRALTVTSRRASPPRTDDLAKSVQTLEKKPSFLIALGNEEIRVRARIDLVDWTEGAPAPKKKP
ncbi:MAG: Amuc_1100 family pilus-like protein [Verrucomicrobium sp.]|nr:Amuc_1100 family pilus-like protein [Verrucomicrobium sp.]